MFEGYSFLSHLEHKLPLEFIGDYPARTFPDDAMVFLFQLLLWKKSTDDGIIKDTQLQYNKHLNSKKKLENIFSLLNEKYFSETNVFEWFLLNKYSDKVISYVVNLVNNCSVNDTFFDEYLCDVTGEYSENYYRLKLYDKYFSDGKPVINFRYDRDACLSYELKILPFNSILITNNKYEYVYHKIYNLLLKEEYTFVEDDFYYVYKQLFSTNKDDKYNLISSISDSLFKKDKESYESFYEFYKMLTDISNKQVVKLFNNTFLAKTVGKELSFKKAMLDQNVTHLVVCRGKYPTDEEKNHYLNVVEFYINKEKTKNNNIYFYSQKVSHASSEKEANLFEEKILNSEIDKAKSSIVKLDNIIKNNYDLTPENYFITDSQVLELKQSYDLVKLSDFVDIKRAQPVKIQLKKEVNYEFDTLGDLYDFDSINVWDKTVSIISPDDLTNYGFTKRGSQYSEKKIVNLDKLQKLKLQNYDILLTFRGKLGKVGIYYVEDNDKESYPNQSLLILRLKENFSSDYVYPIYMFLKSEYGQRLIKNNTLNINGVNQISVNNIENLPVVKFDENTVSLAKEAFYKEIELYEKLEKELKSIEKQVYKVSNNWLLSKQK